MQQKVWEKNQALKTWTFFLPYLFSSLHSTCSSTRRSIIVPSTFVHGMRVSSADCRVEFFFLRPLLKGYLYMWLLTSSCPAQRLMMPGDSRPENWRVVKVLLAFCCSRTLCVIMAWLFHLFFAFTLFSWAAIAAFTRFTYLQPHFTQKTKMDFTPRPGSSINWREGNGDSRGGLPLRWGALFASTLLHST